MVEAILEQSDKIRTTALNGTLYTVDDDNDLYDFLRMMYEVPYMREEWGLVVGEAG
jgi:hypothetical protein